VLQDAERDGDAPGRSAGRSRIIPAALVATLVVLLAVPHGFAVSGPSATAALVTPDTVRVAGAAPASWDPALQGDVGTAAVLAQVFDGLTTFDSQLRVQPALARSWAVSQDGLRVTFQLRPGLRYSDGSLLTSADVVASWLHLLDPAQKAPLASLLDGVAGARAYRGGSGPREQVGIRAVGDAVEVDLLRPASEFPAIVASPSLAVIPPAEASLLGDPLPPARFVGSGAYVVTALDGSSITLSANPNYWAGAPAIGTVKIITDICTSCQVDVFANGDVDFVPISAADATWVRYDKTLGPQLRRFDSDSIDYYGFETRRPPFDDVRVRRAFARAVDWRRLVELGGDGAVSATSLLPPGIPGGSSADFVPTYDPVSARADLAAAGYPGGKGFPTIALISPGTSYDMAAVQELRNNLGVDVRLETTTAAFDRLTSDPPAFWQLSWIADYPRPEDFLGLLLGSRSATNYGGWSDPAFDRAMASAATARDPATRQAAYDAAQGRVRDGVPVVPVSYGSSWALARDGLLGAIDPGDGIVRYAGLAWKH